MAQTNIPRAETAQEFWEGDDKEHRRRLAVALNQSQKGITNNHFSVTLEANETTTEVMHPPVRLGGTVQITPATASAATSFAAGTIWVETETAKAIIHHDSSTATDRTFHLAFFI